MPFKTGKVKTGGRLKGTPNAVSLTLREQVQNLLENQYETILADLKALESKDRVNAWIKLLDFALPKLQRSEVIFEQDPEALPKFDIDSLTSEEAKTLLDLMEKSKGGKPPRDNNPNIEAGR